MLGFIKNAKIKTLGTAMAVLLIVAGVIVIGNSVFTMTEVRSIGETWEKFDKGPAAKVVILNDLRDALGYGGMIHNFKNFVLRKDRPRIVKIQATVRAATVALTAYGALGVNEREKAALKDIAGVVAKYADTVAAIEKMASDGNTPTEIDKAVKISDKPALKGLAALDAEMAEARKVSAAAVYDAVATVERFVGVATVAIGLILVFLIAALIWFTRWRLVQPLTQIGNVVSKLAEGDTSVEIPAQDRQDEIGGITAAVQVFKDNMIENTRMTEEVKKQNAEAARLLQMIDTMPVNVMLLNPSDFTITYVNQTSKTTLGPLQRLLPCPVDDLVGQCFDIFHKNPAHQRRILSDPKNLPYQAQIALGDETLDLQVSAVTDTNGHYMGAMLVWEVVTQKVQFAGQVKEVVEAVAASSTEMQSTAESMASTAEETSNQASAVATASEELTASVNEISQQVSRSATIAANAVEEAERSNAMVQGLAEAADKIGEVVNLITDIASQTNLLALNATIEAARAGDAGKGFAVVASEVKNLANQTAKATEDIAAQVASIQGATQDTVSSIQGIGKTIGEISEIATTISSAVEEQTAATQEVTSNITGVTTASGETGQAANQVLKVASELSRQGEQLTAQIDAFLGQDANEQAA